MLTDCRYQFNQLCWSPADSLGILRVELIPRMLAACSLRDPHPSWELGPLLAEHFARAWPAELAAEKVAA